MTEGWFPSVGKCGPLLVPPGGPEMGSAHTHTCVHMIVWVSLVAQTVKNLPAMKETWIRSLGQ